MTNWSITRRLTFEYATALFFLLIVFGIGGIALLNYTERTLYGADLLNTAQTVNRLSTLHGGSFHPHEIDAKRIAIANGTLAESAIFRSDGTLVYSSSPAIPAFVDGFTSNAQPQKSVGTFNGEHAQWLAAVSPILDGGIARGVVVSWHSQEDWLPLAQRLTTSLIYLLPVFALVALLFGGAIARQGLRPLYAMAGLVSEIEARDLSRRVPLRGLPRELERLASAFNNMLDRLEAAFTRERQFTADASHELRAPLTVIRATAEYALQSDRDGTEYRRALQTIGFEAEDLETLIRDLLAAARSDSMLGAPNATVDLSTVVFDAIEEFYPIARSSNIVITQDLTNELNVTIDPQSTTRLIRVLLDNGLRHASTSVSVRVEHEGSNAVLTVSDDGDGFSDDALRHATERFWRDDRARRRGEGTGLGLSLALGITEGAGGHIDLNNVAPHGAEVRVTLPIAT